MESELPPVQPYSKKELAALYNVTPKTFRRWLKKHSHKIGDPCGRLFSPKQVQIIFDIYGIPSN